MTSVKIYFIMTHKNYENYLYDDTYKNLPYYNTCKNLPYYYNDVHKNYCYDYTFPRINYGFGITSVKICRN